jgi:hypothetical protein
LRATIQSTTCINSFSISVLPILRILPTQRPPWSVTARFPGLSVRLPATMLLARNKARLLALPPITKTKSAMRLPSHAITVRVVLLRATAPIPMRCRLALLVAVDRHTKSLTTTLAPALIPQTETSTTVLTLTVAPHITIRSPLLTSAGAFPPTTLIPSPSLTAALAMTTPTTLPTP